MKKNINVLLMAALVCGLSLSVVSCKDDKNSDEPGGNGTEQQEQQAQEQAERENTCFAILDNLANVSNATDDFLKQTFEPSIGEAEDGDANTRIVNTNTMKAAAERFADLVDAAIDENTTSYSWSDDMIGTMTYNKSTDGKSWATVDVNIKQIPHLQKIIYRSPEQSGDNNAFKGTAYYRFGDVVSKPNADGNVEYWVCVRPAFGPEKKQKSHWITLSPLPSKNIWKYKGSNKTDYALPTKLGDNFEHSQNFAEMLYAICFPQQWENNVTSNAGLPMFNDFDKSNIDYHNQYFWKRVQQAWTSRKANQANDQSVIAAVFDSYTNLEVLKNMLNSKDGLNLLTNGYSWITKGLGATNSPTLYRYRFTNGNGKQSNMHKQANGTKYESIKKEVIKADIQLDVTDYYEDGILGWRLPEFFGSDNYHFIIRHATGADLSSNGKENEKTPLKGVTEVYRYNQYYGITDLNADPEKVAPDFNDKQYQNWSSYRGDSHYRFGDIYQDEQGHKWIVLLLSGRDAKNKEYVYGDSACFTELISFDGLTPSADKRKITNLPTRDQAIRAGILLHFYNMISGLNYKNEKEELIKNGFWNNLGITIFDQIETANFDPRMTYQVVRAQQEKHWKREPSYLGSIAYNDPNDNSGNQRLLRLIANYQNDKNDPHFYLWEHYVSKPNSTSELYADNLYNTPPIYLQDIASDDMVSLYSEDSYARQPIYATDAFKYGATGDDRLPRSKADDLAKDVTNYYYDMARWQNRTFPLDMWNEPVLMFRTTAVYDRGDKEYATITTDGHVLRPLKLRDPKSWLDNGDDLYERFSIITYDTWSTVMCDQRNDIYLDGKIFKWPDPHKTWSK